MQLDDYDGAAAIAAACADGLRPLPSLIVSAWADRHRVLSPRGANEAGPWRTAGTPYLKEITNHLSPSHPFQRVVFLKGAQTGGTEAGNNFLGYVMHYAPGSILAVQSTVELAKRFEHLEIEGGPGSARGWAALDVLLARTGEHASGVALPRQRLAIDTDCEAPAVYTWAAPVMGVEGCIGRAR